MRWRAADVLPYVCLFVRIKNIACLKFPPEGFAVGEMNRSLKRSHRIKYESGMMVLLCLVVWEISIVQDSDVLIFKYYLVLIPVCFNWVLC